MQTNERGELKLDELDRLPEYYSECEACDFKLTTADNIYRFCPLCGLPIASWEHLGNDVRGKRVA
jgi:hypothetical protein